MAKAEVVIIAHSLSQVRRILVTRFPYQVVYRIGQD